MIVTAATYATPAALWIVVLWRAPSAVRSGDTARSLTITLAAIALAFTLRITQVVHLLDVTLGVRDLSVLIKHGSTVISACFLLDYVNALHDRTPHRVGPLKARHLPALVAGIAMLVLFFGALPRTSPSDLFPVEHTVGASDVAYMTVFYGYLGVSLAMSGHTFWTHRSRGQSRFQVAAYFLTAGCAVGCAYTAYRILIAFVREEQGRPLLGDEGITVALTSTAVLLLVVGVSIPPLHTLGKRLRGRRATWVIHPLWSDLTVLYPGVVLGTPTGRLRNLFAVGGSARDVVDLVIEIRDARLSLARNTPAELFQSATAAAAVADLDEEGREVYAEAAWLHAALAHASLRTGPGPGPVTPRKDPSRTRNPEEETDWFLKVARVYRQLGRTYRTAGRPGARSAVRADA